MSKTKPFYKSKELWIALFGVYNLLGDALGLPHIEPTEEFIAAIIGAIAAVRVLFTETKLTLKNE